MATNNATTVNFHVTIGGVEAAEKNLDLLRSGVTDLSAKIKELNKQKVDLTAEGKDATKVIRAELDARARLKQTQELIRLLENEIGSYENIMENLSGATLTKLNKAQRDLVNQMKQQVAVGDIDRWKQYNEALKEVRSSIEQLNGRAPNLGYVLANLNSVAGKTLDDSADYIRRLIADTDIGSAKLIEYQEQLRRVQEQQRIRLSDRASTAMAGVDSGSFAGTAEEAREAIRTLEQYKDALNLTTQQDEIQKVNTALESYNIALGKVKEATVSAMDVVANPKAYSTAQIEQAVKALRELMVGIPIGETERIKALNADIEMLNRTLEESKLSAQNFEWIVRSAENGTATVTEMEKAVQILNDRLRRTPQNASAEIEDIRRKLDVLNPALNRTRQSLANVQGTLGNINAASVESLQQAAKLLEEELRRSSTQMEGFAEKATQLRQVRARIKEVESAWSNTATQMEKAIDRLKNWVLVYAGFNELTQKARQALDANLRLSDSMADVQKTTGMTADQVAALSDELQALDTRVANGQLMEMAYAAGQLGLAGEDVLKFTSSASVVLTALDDLDRNAVTSVMKLNGLLGETARLGVDNAMLSTASAINELGQASSAASQPIIDFSRRFGGIAAQANMSTAEVLALGATIDALGQPIEMSSTALNKFTTALLSNTRQIAEDTGISEEYMFTMARQGQTMQLMIDVLSKLNNMGGVGEISKYMGDMGGDGARMTAVISALAANLDFLQANLDLSVQSFDEAISVINEYNIKNETAAALVKRMGNDIYEAFVGSSFVGTLTDMLRPMQQFIHWLTSGDISARAFNAVLAMLVGSLISTSKWFGNVRQSMNQFFTEMTAGFSKARAEVIATTAATTAFGRAMATVRVSINMVGRALKTLFISNPVGWFLVISSTVMEIVTWLTASKKGIEENTDAISQLNARLEEEEYKLVKLRRAADEAGSSTEARRQVISQLNRDYGKHLGFLLEETASYEKLTQAIDLATAAVRKKSYEDALARNEQDIADQYRDRMVEETNALNEYIDRIGLSAKQAADLRNAIMKDLHQSVESGQGVAEIGESTRRVWEDIISSQSNMLAKQGENSRGWSAQEQKNRVQYAIEATEAQLTDLKELFEQRQQDIKSAAADLEGGLASATEALLDERQKMEQVMLDDLQRTPVTQWGQNEIGMAEAWRKNAREMLGLLKEGTDDYDAAVEAIRESEELQREAYIAFADAPFRVIRQEVGTDGKMRKVFDKNGHLVYEMIQDITKATVPQQIEAFKYANTVFEKMRANQENLMDESLAAATSTLSTKLSALRTAVNKNLKSKGLDIDEKGNIKLRNTEYRDGSDREANIQEKEMRKAYDALLANVKEYYDRKQQVVLDGYLRQQLTVEQKEQELARLEREHASVRIAMQAELMGRGNGFDEQHFLHSDDEGELQKRMENYSKVMRYVQSSTNNLSSAIAADIEAGNVKIRQALVKRQEEMERILMDGLDFQKIGREYQTQLEKLNLFFYDKGITSPEQMQRRADQTVSILADTARRADVSTAETFSAALMNAQDFAHLTILTADGQSKEIIDLTRQEWEVVWRMTNKYINDIQDARTRMYEQNHNTVEKLIEQDDAMRSLRQTRDGQDRQHNNYSLIENLGSDSDTQMFRQHQAMITESLETETAMYLRRLDIAAQYYDGLLAAQQQGSEQYKAIEEAKNRELADMQKEYDTTVNESIRQMTEQQIAEYNRRATIADEYGGKLGDFMGVMASAAWNSVEDRKRAGEELLRYMAEETAAYIKELLIRQIKEKAFGILSVKTTKDTQEGKKDATEKGEQATSMVEDIAGKARVSAQQLISGTISGMVQKSAAADSTAAVKEAQVTGTAGIAAGAGKTIGKLGWWGIPLIAVISAAINALLGMATSALSSAFGKSTGTTTSSSKRLAAGMLTYAEGRYPVQGADGKVYDAQFEPRLQTRIYDGGRNRKAHFGIFSEAMPEMVVSGPTTRIIQQDYPQLLSAIMTIERHGRLRQAMPVFADGNVESFLSGLAAAGSPQAAPAAATSTDTEVAAALRVNAEITAALLERLRYPIQAQVNTYGKGGLKDSLDKADRFYQKNKLNRT